MKLRYVALGSGVLVMALTVFSTPGPRVDTPFTLSDAVELSQTLGNDSAGVYYDYKSKSPIVPVTTEEAAKEVSKAGGVPEIVSNSLADLEDAKQTLMKGTDIAGTSWAIDPASNAVLVTADSSVSKKDWKALEKATRPLGATVELNRENTEFRTFVAGGDAILGKERCSAGLNVTYAGNPFLLTAGHCGTVGSQWRLKNGTPIGPMVESSFPGNDYALIKYQSFGGYPSLIGTQKVFQVSDPTVGIQVQRVGSTTGIHEGRVTGLNASINYGGGNVVTGLIQTNVCAEPGDSGGPLYSGGIAYGLLSGGYGNCKVGGSTFYQPLTEIFNRYSLNLNS